jgi:hypothetical protein
MGWVVIFSLSMMLCIIRAMMSLPPPGAAWQTNSMGLVRNFWAWDSAVNIHPDKRMSNQLAKNMLFFLIEFPPSRN